MISLFQGIKGCNELNEGLGNISTGGGWGTVFAVMSFLVTLAVATSADPSFKAGLKNYQAGSPMEKVHLDFLGPLPRTEAGNEYILMMVDSFTKWVECVPLPPKPQK